MEIPLLQMPPNEQSNRNSSAENNINSSGKTVPLKFVLLEMLPS